LGTRRGKACVASFPLVGPVIPALRQTGVRFRQIVVELTRRGIHGPRGGGWTAIRVRNVLLRSDA
jgi:hypothetical protein